MVASRRQFLRSVALGVAAAPLVGSSWALGGAGDTSPNERLSLGIIGVGNMGGAHLNGFLGFRSVQITAICDVDRGKRERAAKKVDEYYAGIREKAQYKGCSTYNEFEELLAREDIDAVLIAVPDHWHALISIAACAAGKDVYCEKPLSLTIRDARAMVQAARRYGRVFQTGSQQRSSANFRQACELVRSGRIGKLETVHVGVEGPSHDRYFEPQPVPEGFDWERWLGPAPWAPYHFDRCSGNYSGGWRYVRDYSGGMMTDWGAHHFDIAQWGMGMDHSGPCEVIAPDGEQPLTYRYENGVTMFHGGANGVLFTGTEGKIEVNRGYLRSWPDRILEEPLTPSEVHLYQSPGHQQDWLECIRTRRRPICDVEVGCRSVTVCHLGNIAHWTGRSFEWDPAREEIVGDPVASRWLGRPKRAPWRLQDAQGATA